MALGGGLPSVAGLFGIRLARMPKKAIGKEWRTMAMKGRVVTAIVGLLCLLFSQRAQADIVYNDGQVHSMAGLYGYQDIYVDYPPPPPLTFTTVNFDAVAWSHLSAFNNSRVNMNGGHIEAVLAYDSSRVTMNGTHDEDALLAYDDSQVIINDGYARYFFAYDNSRVTINGGDVAGSGFQSIADDNSRVTINGGHVDRLDAYGSSRVTMNGGWVASGLSASGDSRMTIRGGSFDSISTGGQAVTTIGGSDFTVYRDYDRTDLVFSGYGDLGSSLQGCWLWGTLANGDQLSGVGLGIGDGSPISLVPVPLPGAVLLGALGLSCAGWRLRRR